MEKVRLGDICNILNGYAFKSSEYKESGIRVIRITNVQSGYIEDKDPKYYSFEKKTEIEKYMLKDNDILISLTGNVGRVGLLKKEMLPAVLNQRVACIRIKENKKISINYVFNILNTKKFLKQCEINSKGIAQKNLSTEWLKNYLIDIPDFREQAEISNKLNKVQEIIDFRKKQIEELDELIKLQFIEMFGDPNIVKNDEKIELKKIMINANNGMARRGNDSDGNIVLRLVELQRNYIDYANVNRIILKDNEKKKYLLSQGDILFARVNGNPDNVGRCAYFKDIGENVYYNDHIIRVKFDLGKINPIYLCILLNDEYGKSEFKNKIKTSAGQYTISQDGIGKVKILLPPIELQNKFADFVNQINKQKIILEKSLKETEELQDSLMNKYFGE